MNDILITREIPRVLGGLCQEPGKNNGIFFYYTIEFLPEIPEVT